LLRDDYQRLVAIARWAPDAQICDDHALRLLSRRRVLYYRDQENSWFNVHPPLIEDERFRHVHDATSSLITG
jgi:hypothetical protein